MMSLTTSAFMVIICMLTNLSLSFVPVKASSTTQLTTSNFMTNTTNTTSAVTTTGTTAASTSTPETTTKTTTTTTTNATTSTTTTKQTSLTTTTTTTAATTTTPQPSPTSSPTDINECANNTCKNGANCTDGVNSYTCACKVGYTGKECETNINDCVNITCQHGGSCVDGVNSYTCNCSAGFTGSTCETNITSGATSSTSTSPQTSPLSTANTTISGQSSTMQSTGGIIVTQTSPSETSTTASTSTLDITSASTLANTSPATEITVPSTGNVSTIEGTLPTNNVSLTSSSIEMFSTTTPTPNSTNYSFTEVVISSSSPSILTSINSHPNSTFVSSSSSSLNSSGDNVTTSAVSMTTKSTSIQESTSRSDTGSTTNPGVTGPVSTIHPPATTPNINDCVNITCQNGGSCVDGVNSYTCNCSAGFTGSMCETNINDCVNITCQNGGTCVDGVNSYTCNCSAGFTGSKCETNINDCVNNTCQNGGSCVDGVNTYTCNCSAGFTGIKCETNINDCVNITCQNGGACVDGVNSYTCNCSAGFTGSMCETNINDCVNITCQNGGSCVDGVNSYTCNCSAGFTGSKCETNIKECVVMKVECQNNGTCNDGDNNYTCSCQTGWEGRHCEKDIDECTSKTHKCHINAICANNNGSYDCTCRNGYTGDGFSCKDNNECENKTLCENGASCVNTPGSFRCFCQDGWQGQFCHEDIDECLPQSSCAANANCTNTEGSFNCSCQPGFRGDGFDKCVQEVLISVEIGRFDQGDDTVFGPLHLQENLCLNGKQYNSFYVSMNGYITFGTPVYQRYPPEDPQQWKSFNVPVIAPLWSDIVTSGQNSGLRVSIVNDSLTLEKLGKAFNTTNLRFSIVCTWNKAVPYPFEQNAGHEFADFQAIIAVTNNGSKTKIMFNYDKEFFTWKKASDKKVAIGMSNADFSGLVLLNSSNFTSVYQGNKHDNSSRWILDFPQAASCKSEFECLEALDSLTTSRKSAMSDVDPCPCSLLQARRDRKFRLISDNTANIYKFVSRFGKGSLNARQRCHYSSVGSLLKGQPDGGYIDFDTVNATYEKCCTKISKCNLFYMTNPSDHCGAYIAPAMALSWGDPHITTLDGATYTFNGRGEYTLVKVNHSNIYIDVQVRTENVNGNLDATNFVGLAAQDDTRNKIEIILHNNASANVYTNDTWKALFPTSNEIEFQIGNMTVYKQSNETLTILFTSGMSVDVTVGSMLDIVVSASRNTSAYFGHLVGLLGNNNGNSLDDFRPRNDSDNPLRSDSSESDIFSRFGQTWMVKVPESLFNYNVSGGNYSYYNNLSIHPSQFLSDINTTSIQQYINDTCKGKLSNVTICGDNKACIVDAIATCDIKVGESSQKTEETAIIERKLIGNMPPKFDLPDVLYIWYGLNKTVTLALNVNNATVTYKTSIDKNAYDGNISFFFWNVSENLRNTSVYLKIVAVDLLNASAEYWPRIVYCGCEDSSQCDISLIEEDGPVEDHFYRARCRCPQNFTGDFCQIHVEEPCFGNSSRINGECKCPGLAGDGIRCYDINECYKNISMCTQQCTNTEGSYTCGCNPGWMLQPDKQTCVDVDECDTKTTPCKSGSEYCINTIGSYNCSCLPGFTESNGLCINVKDEKHTYAGALVYNTTETNETKIKEAVKSVLTAIFTHLVTVIDVLEVNERFKRDVETGTTYRSNFLVFYNSSQSSVELTNIFKKYIVNLGLTDDSYFYAENVSIPLFISTKEFKMISENEGGICGTPSIVTCDSISTNCSAINGGYQCKCKNGFEGWETPYISCKDVDECLSAKEKCVGGERCENTPGSFVCHCPNGHKYDGSKMCIDMCESSPCKNGGQCIHGTAEGQYVCKCDDKWTGPTCENDNSEAQKLKTIAIAVGASLGAVCFILLFALLGMYRRHKNRYSGYSRRPLSAYDFDSTMNFGQTELRTKDFPLDDENSTSFSIPRPQIVNENKYQLAENVKTYDNAAEGDTGKMEEPKQPLTKQSGKTPENGAENPSFLHSSALEGDRRSSKRQSKNPYEYF